MNINWFRNRKTTTKLMSAFQVLGIMTVLVGVVGYWSNRHLGNYVVQSYEDGLMPVANVAALQKDIYELRLAVLNFWRSIGTPAAMAKFEERALKEEAAITKAGETVAASAKTPEESALIENWRKAWEHCIAAHREVLRLGDAGDRDGALQVITGTGEHGSHYGDHFAGVLAYAEKLAELKQERGIASLAKVRAKFVRRLCSFSEPLSWPSSARSRWVT